MDGTATAPAKDRFEIVGQNVQIHRTDEPVAQEPVLLDAQEHPVEIRRGLVARMDARVSETITLSRGLAGLWSAAIATVSVVITLIVSGIYGAMSYQTVVSRVGTVETRVEKLEKLDEKVNILTLSMATVSKDVTSIHDKQTSDETDRKELMKNVGDIRILLAGKQLQAP